MSEILGAYKEQKLEWTLKLGTEFPLQYKSQHGQAGLQENSWEEAPELDEKVYKLSVRRMETESIEALKAEVEKCQNELEEWKRKYVDLENEKKKLYDNMKNEINKLGEEITDLKQVNKDLAEYVETLERKESLKCQGRKLDQLSPKQVGRKLKLLQNKAQCALWFCKSYGLELKNIEIEDQNGHSHKLDYCGMTSSGNYENLSQNEKNKIDQVLFLMDKFCMGDDVYHELTMMAEGLPKSYLIKQSRAQFNKTYHIERTPGKYPGASINFTTTLQDHVRELLRKEPELKGSKIQVKLSGDGARMTRTTNFMMMSFTLLQLNESVMSSKHNRTVAIINGPEKYETLKTSLSPFFHEVNQLISKGTLSIDGEEVELEFFLGGDMKFLLMILGLSSATADYACLWCKIHKDNRWDTSKHMGYYNEEPIRRTLEEIKSLCHSKDNFGCIHQPLLDIPITHIVPDELHLLLRITDKLLQNVIDEVLERDAVEDFEKSRGQPKGVYLNRLVKEINGLGISFSVWNKRNADGSESQVKEFTSLLGFQKKKLLYGFPSKLHECIYPDTCATVKKIWTDFGTLYDKISDFKLTETDANDIFVEGKAWIELFCSLRGVRPGYIRPRVTPYMHLIPYHLPFFVQKHGCLKKFTGQGVEKNNDDAKRILFQKSNKWDSAKDILCTESRQWDLKHHEREKGTYTKRKLAYWDHDIRETKTVRNWGFCSFSR
ncbi:hypothetical protein OS493_026112 [Desmophyllum pertusum]|uniref:Uncharacterized protein n=1 Tax=Desmophyllum pertusum TaxID=174260 RepID=A0A9X0CF63_9CNID|nr:hypothetical protein OS493_026112 [Desmophyllum pertusum]